MTTTLPPAPQAPTPTGPTSDALVQDEPRRGRDFGIDRRRLRRLRLIVFAILALPILALCLLVVRFVSMPLTQAWHDDAYADKDFTTASERLGPVESINWFEPYLPHLTHGTDLLQAGDDAGAEKELRVALETWQGSSDLNQPAHAECKILNNLAISIERQADRIADPAARGDRLFEAETLLAPCAGGGGGGEGDGQGGGGQGEEQGEGQGNGNEDEGTTGGNGERIQDKREEADREAGKDPSARGTDPGPEEQQNPSQDPSNSPQHEDPSGSGPTQEAPTEGDSEEQKKQEELEERNESANQGGDGDNSTGGAPQNPDKPW
ncbi:hypothetical protein ACT3TZ_01395 [Brachybacterium sp. AOP25-B2-12]|uniref:hypothetical protein n=1 Tax=Brachybacterium sp. AOP25-B2-12 TaxID=3457710 RepID=UPI004034648B